MPGITRPWTTLRYTCCSMLLGPTCLLFNAWLRSSCTSNPQPHCLTASSKCTAQLHCPQSHCLTEPQASTQGALPSSDSTHSACNSQPYCPQPYCPQLHCLTVPQVQSNLANVFSFANLATGLRSEIINTIVATRDAHTARPPPPRSRDCIPSSSWCRSANALSFRTSCDGGFLSCVVT